MKAWKSCTAFVLVIALASCQSTAKMTVLDRALVKKTVSRLPSGGVQIDMNGDFIFNPTAAIETFHTVAEKQMGGRPYRYAYALNKDEVTRTVKAKQPAKETKPAPTGPGYIPIYTTGGPGSMEAAVVMGSLALLIILARLANENKGTEDDVQVRVLNISGTAEPIAPVALDRSRVVEVVVPDAPPMIGRLKPQVARGLAEAVRSAFAAQGLQAVISDAPRQGGYVARTTVLRAQGNFITYTSLTVEVNLQDARTGRELTRLVVQAAEKPFDLKAQTERQNQGGIASSLLVKPLAAKLRGYVR